MLCPGGVGKCLDVSRRLCQVMSRVVGGVPVGVNCAAG
jgi:hypothetical protein